MSVPMTDARPDDRIYRRAAELAGTGVFVLCRDGTLLFMDQAAFDLFGLRDRYTDPSSVKGKPAADVFSPPEPMAALARKTAGDAAETGRAVQITTTRGKRLIFRACRASADLYDAGAVLVTVQADRTMETHAVRAMDAEINSLIYAVSHDFRAPIRAVDGFSQALEEDCAEALDDMGRDFMHRIRRAAGRLNAFIDALLFISRATRQTLDPEPVDLSALAADILGRLQETAPDRDVHATVQPGLSAVMDRRMAGVLMENLLDNAWKFTAGRRPARIDFGITAGDDGPAFRIRDNGVGFDPAYAKDRLFGIFQRMHGQDEFEGLGTGLAAARRIINRHGGRIWADAEPDAGATFYFTV